MDRYSGYRYYELQQLPRLNRLLALREMGFPLVQIERLLREDLSSGELQRLMQLRQAEITQQVAAEQARPARVGARLRQIELEGRQPRDEVLVKPVQPRQVAGIRDRSPSIVTSGPMELRSYLGGAGSARSLALPGSLLRCRVP